MSNLTFRFVVDLSPVAAVGIRIFRVQLQWQIVGSELYVKCRYALAAFQIVTFRSAADR